MRYFFLLVLFSSCGHGYTRCGLKLSGDVEGGQSFLTEWALQEAEDAALDAFAKTGDHRLQDRDVVCHYFRAVRVFTRPEKAFTSDGRWVAGMSWCDHNYIIIGTPDELDWRKSSLVHELAHIAQGCMSIQPPTEGRDADHSNWDRDNIESAIVEANSWKP